MRASRGNIRFTSGHPRPGVRKVYIYIYIQIYGYIPGTQMTLDLINKDFS